MRYSFMGVFETMHINADGMEDYCKKCVELRLQREREREREREKEREMILVMTSPRCPLTSQVPGHHCTTCAWGFVHLSRHRWQGPPS